MRLDRRLLTVLAIGAALWAVLLADRLGTHELKLIDLRVYRTAGLAWLRDLPLYDSTFPQAGLGGPRLPFTYPPLAAMLFAGLAVLPWWVAVGVVVATGIAGIAWACWLAATRLAADRRDAVLLAAGAVAVAPLLEPVVQTVAFGQINLLLAGVIAADCLMRRTPWPRGLLIGLAAAVKLTPAAFVLFFVARRQWRPVLMAMGGFVAAGVLGHLTGPRDSRDYWLGALLDPGRIGNLEFASNQSLRGALHRLALPESVETASWLALSAAVGVLALYGVAHLRRRGDDPAALLVTAAAALLVSPVSWSHHWVWAVPGAVWLMSRPRPAHMWAGLAALVIFVAGPFWWLPYRDQRELNWSLPEYVLGNAYVWAGLAVIVAAAVAALRAGRQPQDKINGPLDGRLVVN